MISISGVVYDHYGMVIVPLVIYPVAKTLQEVDSHIIELKIKKSVLFILGVLVLGLEFNLYLNDAKIIFDNCVKNINGNNLSPVVSEICSTIDELNLESDEAISVYGNWDIIYIASKKKHATKYSYQFPIGEVNSEIMKDYFEELQRKLPKIVIVQGSHYDDSIKKFLSYNDYVLKWKQKEDEINGNLLFYKEI